MCYFYRRAVSHGSQSFMNGCCQFVNMKDIVKNNILLISYGIYCNFHHVQF